VIGSAELYDSPLPVPLFSQQLVDFVIELTRFGFGIASE
jgi:hypothetical protein